jgi:hypothetical protein
MQARKVGEGQRPQPDPIALRIQLEDQAVDGNRCRPLSASLRGGVVIAAWLRALQRFQSRALAAEAETAAAAPL